MSVMDQAPEALTPEQESELTAASKEAAREMRKPQTAIDNNPVETITEGSSDPTAELGVTDRDLTDLGNLHAAAEPALDDRQQKIDIARETADAAMEAMPQKPAEGQAAVAPGSPEEAEIYAQMREARRGGNMPVDGLQSAPASESSLSTSEEEPTVPLADDTAETPVVAEKQKGFISKNLDRLEKLLGGK